MSALGLLRRRVRGFRVVDVAALLIVLALALSVYAFKTVAGHEREGIADVESDIAAESARVRMLKAQIAHLESPDRLERLARAHAGQAPIAARQEVAEGDLAGVAQPQLFPPSAGGSVASRGPEGQGATMGGTAAPLPPRSVASSPPSPLACSAGSRCDTSPRLREGRSGDAQ